MGFWQDRHAATIDPERFRAHDQYLEQRDDFPYDALVADLKERGKWRPELTEDGAFGCVTSMVDGVMVSRDLLDSMNEIAFLEECGVPLASARVLDIGAGYGRFAYRLVTAYPEAGVVCTDEIPTSLDVCCKYLAHRNPKHVWISSPDAIIHRTFSLAVNIHSWPECTREEVRWWLAKLVDLNVPQLFVIPHGPNFDAYGGGSFLPDIEAAGYVCKLRWTGPVCKPKDYYLFERRA